MLKNSRWKTLGIWALLYFCGMLMSLAGGLVRSPALYASWEWIWIPTGVLCYTVGLALAVHPYGGKTRLPLLLRSCFQPLSQSKKLLGFFGSVLLLAFVALPAFAMPLEAVTSLLAGLGSSLRGALWLALWNADVLRWMLIGVVSYAWFRALVRWNGVVKCTPSPQL